MGQQRSFPSESEEVLTERLSQSRALSERRQQKHKVYSQMFNHVITEPAASPFEVWSLPEPAVTLLLQFLAPDIHNLLQVSATWHCSIVEAIDAAFSPIESQFALVHSNILSFRSSSFFFSKIEVSSRKGTRLDRVIVAEPLPLLKSHTIKLRYTYRFHNSSNTYKAEFKLDCVSPGKRSVWTHRDECRFHGEENRRAYTQQIPNVCVGDFIELCISWFNLLGLVNLESVQWQPPLIQDTRALIKSLQLAPDYSKDKHDENEGIKKKMYLYNVARHCEVELSQTEWYDSSYYTHPNEVYISNHFGPFLRLVKCEFAGVDVVISKNTYRAERCGVVPGALAKIGIGIEIVPESLYHEVKRIGLIYDRNRPLQLRLGDTFVLYISRGG